MSGKNQLCLLAAALVAVAGVPVSAETVGALTCTLESKHLAVSLPGSWGGMEQGNTITLTYTAIDLDKLTARIAQSPTSGDVRVVRAPGVLTFVETTATGGISATTVLTGTADFADHTLNAVHSRHVVTSDHEMIVAQYIGFCERGP